MSDISTAEGSLYVSRSAEQRRILDEAAEVVTTGESRAVLLYGSGGTGKTRLVRKLPELAQDREDGRRVIWLDSIDVDDSQHWLLSNLEQYVADQLDPEHQYFGPYFEYLSALPRHRLTPTSREMVLEHLNRNKDIFAQCYKRYIDGTGKSVVITFDTIEAIRGMHLLRTLTQWMKSLPSTLFILAGRLLADADKEQDPIRLALKESPRPMNVIDVELGPFNAADARQYLASIAKKADLPAEQTEKLVHLTQGHPLWLAFTVDHLAKVGMPAEAQASLEEIQADLPYHGQAGVAGQERAESFKNHLMAPYQDGAFWHENIKRLAVVRESVSQLIWQRLMVDSWPGDIAGSDQAWATLGAIEWIRPRANRRYVTLHDAVAEELARRIIDVHDADQRYRQRLWRQAAELYADRAAELERHLAERQPLVDARLQSWNASKEAGSAASVEVGEDAALIRDVTELDRQQQELNQVKAALLSLQLLCDFGQGAQQFVVLLRQAMERHDILFEDLLAFQMQRFLPGQADQSALVDTVGKAISAFHEWLTGEGQDSYVDIGLEMAAYLIDREQADAAISVLDDLPVPPDHERRYRLRNLQGNASMRIPGRVAQAEARFLEALAEARQLPSSDRYRQIADAHKELGFYYRNIGHWENADEAYKQARNAILGSPSPGSPEARSEMASINNNWAYLKGIGGRYNDGINLVESAITIRGRLRRRHEQAISYSVKGEVYRYQRQFRDAWEAYAEAEQQFGDNSLSWLGVIYQEQAICLFQSIRAGVQLLAPEENAAEKAEELIDKSVNICRVFNARYIPSALNRAGRIYGEKDPDRGLRHLLEAAEKAQGLSDGWFWLASLIEYAELCYRTWAGGKRPGYLELIPAIALKLQDPELAEVQFPELRGRWDVLQGHLEMYWGLEGDEKRFDIALDNYRVGFPLITHGWVGSYGASAIPGEFIKFRDLAWRLPEQTRARWRQVLEASWSDQGEAATQLLARLEELY